MKFANGFDYKRQKWDRYEMFHTVDYGTPFVRFDNGMLVVNDAKPNPDQRRHYPSYNLTICATGDDKCPTFYYDGKPIPKAQLNQGGQQYFALDECTGKAWRLYSNWTDKGYIGKVPKCVETHALVWMRKGSDPVARKDFRVNAPDTKLAKRIRMMQGEIQTTVKAMAKLSINQFELPTWKTLPKFEFIRDWKDLTVEQIIAEITKLQPVHIQSIAKYGFTIPRGKLTLPYLNTNQEES